MSKLTSRAAFFSISFLMIMTGKAFACHEATHPCIAVSWDNFQNERRKSDEAAIKAVVEAAGAEYLSTDAQGSTQKQNADIEGLIAARADVIIVVANDSDAILPLFRSAADAGVKMISYDVLVEDPAALYVGFDNFAAGQLMAQEVQKAKPEGNYAFIKGDKSDPNATLLFQGISEVLQNAMGNGKIRNVCETFTEGWRPENAQKDMEQCLSSTNNGVDAVISENDGMAGGVVAALNVRGLAGSVPVSGQNGDKAALNRVAIGTQTVSVWKDGRALGKLAAEAAINLARGGYDAGGMVKFNKGKKGVEVNAILLTPIAIIKDNLNDVIDAGWISKDEVCSGVSTGSVAACN